MTRVVLKRAVLALQALRSTTSNRATGSAVDFSLEGLDFCQNFIEGGHVTDDHFPHARIVFSKRSGETVVRCQAKGARFGTFVVRFGRFEKDRFMMCHVCQQIETLERAILESVK